MPLTGNASISIIIPTYNLLFVIVWKYCIKNEKAEHDPDHSYGPVGDLIMWGLPSIIVAVMAIVTCLLAPATVIGGIFGMNFESIPYLHNQYGFWIAVSVMLVIPVWMISVFKRRGWF